MRSFSIALSACSQRIAPQLGRYRGEEDSKWPEWSRLPLDEIVERLRSLRRRLVERVRSLAPAQLARTALHPTFGEMGLSEWLDFLLLHEAHHLYTAMICIGEARLHQALGAALLAVGVAPEQAGRLVRKRWPWAFAVSVNCPSCGRSHLVCQVIVHLNDDRWTREKIGA